MVAYSALTITNNIRGDILKFLNSTKYISQTIFFIIVFIIIFLSNFNTVNASTTTTLLPGTTLNAKMKTIANNGISVSSGSENTNVTSIKKADVKKEGLTSDNIISTNESDEKVYMWYEDNTLFYYSDADIIYMNSDSSYAFRSFSNLTDISGLQYFNTSKVTNMGRLFIDCINLMNLSYLANWDTSNVTNMYFTFGSNYTGTSGQPMKISDLSPLTNWNTSKVTTMNSMFKGCASIKNLDALKNWDVSNVTVMTQMFNRTGLTDASGIKNWNVSNVTNFDMMLANIPKTTIKPIFTYRPGTWGSNGTFNSYTKTDVTVTVNWEDATYVPNNVKLYLKKLGETTFQTSNDNGWTKNGNIWTYKFAIYDSSTYYIWQETVDNYQTDATESAPKTVTNNNVVITNVLNQHTITLKNSVTGNMGSIYNEFEYTIYLYDKNNNPLAGSVKINNSEFVSLTHGALTTKLKHNETLTINNIADGYKYKVVQKDSDYTEKYVIEKNHNSLPETLSNETGVLILDEDQIVKFINNKEDAVQTGIVTDIFPLVVLILVGILGILIIIKINKITK